MSIKHRVRTDGKGGTAVKTLTARSAIREHCKECMGFQVHEVKLCTDKLCSHFPFRLKEIPKGIV